MEWGRIFSGTKHFIAEIAHREPKLQVAQIGYRLMQKPCFLAHLIMKLTKDTCDVVNFNHTIYKGPYKQLYAIIHCLLSICCSGNLSITNYWKFPLGIPQSEHIFCAQSSFEHAGWINQYDLWTPGWCLYIFKIFFYQLYQLKCLILLYKSQLN